ncbi:MULTISPECIES: hypothetical protein [unclassified Streptomyces]|uniref:hypothetical protein n=1 Tax=unclassified Streptomyces TaxID=2593676 RepID=UPI000380C4DB|nr:MULTISPECIES: hypothetical protein [unclassified Streptomyces]MYT29922.1 hypothetical protein [Streptomyces sp. SID8354]
MATRSRHFPTAGDGGRLRTPGSAPRATSALASVLATTDIRTPDLGGTATTEQFTETLLELL